MAAASYFKNGNRLLQALSTSDQELLQPNLVQVSLPLRQDLEKPNKPIPDVYFMERGIASVVSRDPNGNEVEIGLVGCEGMTGCAVVLGNDRTPHSTYIQVAGEGQRISANQLRSAMQESSTMRSTFLKYVQFFTVQASHTAVANARGKLTERLARWLLMTHDRVRGNEMPLTHEFLSVMLAVRRAGVTEAIHDLASQGLITASRGHITVLNRKGLEKVAGNFYGIPEAEYRRLMN
jgi:CRP-like cAMP-binding protein